MEKEILDLIYSKQLLQGNHLEIRKLELLKGGMTNRNYLCTTTTGQKYVIRIPGRNTGHLIDRQSEWKNHHKITPLDINTKHIVYAKDSWIKVSVYVENIFENVKSKYEIIEIVCKTLRVLHCSGVIFDNTFWVVDKINLYENIIKQNKIDVSSEYRLLRASLKDCCDEYLYSNIKWAACHNDLVKENILLDSAKRAYLIDWEYSGMNDPLWDIASFILENEFNIYEQKEMLTTYYGDERLRPETSQMLALFKIYQDILWYLWSKIKEFYGNDYLEYSNKRLQRAISNFALLKDQKFN